jgi:hypothetical protein
MKKLLTTCALLAAAILLSLGASATAARASASSHCFTPAEAEAEQGIRIHSELMVIGLNCRAMRFSDGTDLYTTYHKFTVQNEKLFGNYEATLINYYRRNGAKDPTAALDTLRTQIANKIAYDAIQMHPDQFCNRYAGRVLKVGGMDQGSIRKWASTIYPGHPLSEPICPIK